jgi:hypothetical protein
MVTPPAEKRRSRRRLVSYRALIDLGDGSPHRECTLCDASQEGAQLMVDDAASLPAEFTLVLSSGGTARRLCRTMWKNKELVGVRFC